jgi:hypothetical protein
MDDRHDSPTDNTDRLRSILLQRPEAAREEVHAFIRHLGADCDQLKRATTVSDLFRPWRGVRERAEAASDNTITNCLLQHAFLIEQRALGLPLTSPRDGLDLMVMTADAGSERARTSQDALVVRAHGR